MVPTVPTSNHRPKRLRNIPRVDYKELAGLNITQVTIEELRSVKQMLISPEWQAERETGGIVM